MCTLVIGEDNVSEDQVALVRIEQRIHFMQCDPHGHVTIESNGADEVGMFMNTEGGRFNGLYPEGSTNLIGYYFGIDFATKQYYLGKYEQVDGPFEGTIGNISDDVRYLIEYDTGISLEYNITLMDDGVTNIIKLYINGSQQGDTYYDDTFDIGYVGFRSVGGEARFYDWDRDGSDSCDTRPDACDYCKVSGMCLYA